MRSELAFCRDIPSHKKSTGYPEDKKFRIPEINIPKLRKIPRLKKKIPNPGEFQKITEKIPMIRKP